MQETSEVLPKWIRNFQICFTNAFYSLSYESMVLNIYWHTMITKHANCNNLDVVSSINFWKCQTILQKKIKIADIFLKKKIKIQELNNHVNNIFIHESKMKQKYFLYLKKNTSSFISLTKDAGYKGTRNEAKFLFWKYEKLLILLK